MGQLLQRQIAVITGASSGIGAGIAREMAAEGATVVINYPAPGSKEAAEGVAEGIAQQGGNARIYQADVSVEEQVVRMISDVVKTEGTLDILVNNAGIQIDAPSVDMTLAQWQTVLNVNLTGQFLCAREAIREFLRRGIDTARSCAAGKIICISSVHETIPWAGHANYTASKGGVMMLMRSLAQEYAPHKIRINSIAPGAIKTPINTSAWSTPAAEKELIRLIPYGRVGEASDIGKAAAWLASDASDYVTGASLFVDGGMMLYPGLSTNG
ncbi:MAG TPA: glucose 1-dehydrogenase [Bacteroidota bacterium]|nr:glucose 1-dehydrogenase [Bacteroidota bacterium]